MILLGLYDRIIKWVGIIIKVFIHMSRCGISLELRCLRNRGNWLNEERWQIQLYHLHFRYVGSNWVDENLLRWKGRHNHQRKLWETSLILSEIKRIGFIISESELRGLAEERDWRMKLFHFYEKLLFYQSKFQYYYIICNVC